MADNFTTAINYGLAGLGGLLNAYTTTTAANTATFDWSQLQQSAYQSQLSMLMGAKPMPAPAAPAPTVDDPRAWLRRRVREITDLAPKAS